MGLCNSCPFGSSESEESVDCLDWKGDMQNNNDSKALEVITIQPASLGL